MSLDNYTRAGQIVDNYTRAGQIAAKVRENARKKNHVSSTLCNLGSFI